MLSVTLYVEQFHISSLLLLLMSLLSQPDVMQISFFIVWKTEKLPQQPVGKNSPAVAVAVGGGGWWCRRGPGQALTPRSTSQDVPSHWDAHPLTVVHICSELKQYLKTSLSYVAEITSLLQHLCGWLQQRAVFVQACELLCIEMHSHLHLYVWGSVCMLALFSTWLDTSEAQRCKQCDSSLCLFFSACISLFHSAASRCR